MPNMKIRKCILSYCMRYAPLTVVIFLTNGCSQNNKPEKNASAIYQYNDQVKTHWSSPENLNGQLGSGGKESRDAKGHAFDLLKAHDSEILLDVKGPGLITRIWLTVMDRSPEMLRSLKFEIFWNDET